MSDKKKLGLAVPNPQRRQCKAVKSNGVRCGNPPIKGATVCRMHGGSAPQVRKKAAERLLAASDSLMAALLKIATSAESEGVRLAAIKDALDRAGFAPAQMVKLGLAQDDPFTELLNEILSDPNLIIDEQPGRRALPAPDRGWGDEWLPEDTIPGEVIPEPQAAGSSTPEPPAAERPAPPRGKRFGPPVKVPTRIRTGLRLDPDAGRATFGP